MEPIRIIMPFLLVVFLSSCAPKYVRVEASPKLDEGPVSRMAVLPVTVDNGSKTGQAVMRTGVVEEGGPRIITDLIYEKLEEVESLDLLPRSVIEQAIQKILEGHPKASVTEQALSAGADLDVPFILTGRLMTFVERVGGNYGIEQPPSVGLDLLLIDTGDGTILWKGSYYETQRSLFEDITTFPLFLKRWGRWQTAPELARYGVNQMLCGSEWIGAK